MFFFKKIAALAARIPIGWLPYLIIFYMSAAFIWWANLLLEKNERAFDAERVYIAEHSPAAEIPMRLEKLKNKFERQKMMIVGEASAFILALGAGLFFIYRSARREIRSAEQQKNFLLSITHELKSPIAGMKLNLETIKKRENLTREQTARLSSNGLRDADRLQNLVNDLLLAARLDEGWRPHFEPIDLGATLESTVAELRTRWPDALFSIKIEDDLPFFRGDEKAVAAIFQNILENAAKYSPPATEIAARLFEEKKRLVFECADRGPGIPNAEKLRVFEKFYRVGSEETRTAKGTGLGLFIVKRVVEAHGGTISIRDNQPSGAIFSVKLPKK